jgi:hypothetical protein
VGAHDRNARRADGRLPPSVARGETWLLVYDERYAHERAEFAPTEQTQTP